MPFVVSIDATVPHLVATASGPAGLPELSGVAALIAEATGRLRITRALVDLGGVVPDLSFTDHLQLGALASSLLSRLACVAVVVPPDFIDAPAARAAQLAGLNVETFLLREEARRFLDQAANGGMFSQRSAG